MAAARASAVQGMLLLLLSLMLCLNPARGQDVYFPEAEAGTHINSVSVVGMQVAGFLRARFLPMLEALMARLDAAEQTLLDELGVEHLPNLTARMDSYLANITAALDTADALVQALNLTEKDEGQAAYFKHSMGMVNVKEPMANDKFTVPHPGVYMITIAPKKSFYVTETQVMLNGNETLAEYELPQYSYYMIPVRVVFRWLQEGDEVYVTGNAPNFFGVNLLRLQTLMPAAPL